VIRDPLPDAALRLVALRVLLRCHLRELTAIAEIPQSRSSKLLSL
jgi:hypothetical protein